jgi:phage terminase Nu1 subunit (DNA packaging protein)
LDNYEVEKIMSEPTYKVGVIARLFGVSERRIQQLAKDGIIPKSVKGKYELVGCVRGYIGFLQERAFGKDVMSIDAHQERARLLKAQADKTELEVKVLSRNMISVEEVKNDWSAMAVSFRSRLLGLPTRGAHLATGLKEFHEVEQALRELVHEALNELSLYDPEANSGTDTQSSAARSASALDDGKPVGGSLSAAE